MTELTRHEMTGEPPVEPVKVRKPRKPRTVKPAPKKAGRKTFIAAVVAAILAAADLYVAVRYPGHGPACAFLKNML